MAGTKKERPRCRHCGAPLLDKRSEESGFCCTGCAYVHRLVSEHGLQGYYQLKDAITPPADASLFQPRDYSWLEALQQAAEQKASEGASPKAPGCLLSIQGISCAGCVWLIERLFQQEQGGRDILVNAQTGEMRLSWLKGSFSLPGFARTLQSFGYLVGPAGEAVSDSESRDLVRRIGLCAAFAMNVMLFTLPVYFGMESDFSYARLFETISLAFGTLSVLTGGSLFASRAARALREGSLHIDLPIALGIAGAYLGSLYGWLAHEPNYLYFDFVSVFILLMLVGRWAQVSAVERNQRLLLRQQLKPPRVRLLDAAGAGTDISPEQLQTGQTFELAPGQSSPVEGLLLGGQHSFSLASINGEADPRLFKQGEPVPAGALNIGIEPCRLQALQRWEDSLLARLLGQGERPGWRHRFLERIIQGYLIGILATALISGLAWGIATGDLLKTGAVVTSILVVSCPCAIGLAFPLADEIAAVALRRKGVFVRENDVWGRLSQVRRIIFDKTGTLTMETPELANPEELERLDQEARDALHTLVRESAHPVSISLRSELLASGACGLKTGRLREVIGQGLSLTEDAGVIWSLGRAQTGAQGTVFSRDGALLAEFHFSDHVRPDAVEELGLLQASGKEIYVLSGDHPEKVQQLASSLGLKPDHALGGLSPEQKASWFGPKGSTDTLMLGDGANDSLAFDRALCRGTPVIHRGILEQKADFFYLGRGVSGIRALFQVDVVRRRAQRAILVFSVLYNALAVGLAVAGRMNPLLAAVLMPLNSLLTLALVTTSMRRVFKPLP